MQLDQLYRNPPRELSNQWILTRDSDRLPGEWRRYALNVWYLGCWAAPVRLVTTAGGAARSYSPMTSAICLETMLRLPEAYRVEGILQRDMGVAGWPDLLRVPFNEPTSLLTLESLALRAQRKASRFARRLRLQ